MHLPMHLQILLIPHYNIYFFKLSTITTHCIFDVKSVIVLLIIQRIFKFQLLSWLIFPFMFDITADILGCLIMQMYWATCFYAILWMIICNTIAYILHMRQTHHFLAYFPSTFDSAHNMFLRSVLTYLYIPPSDPTPVYNHVSNSHQCMPSYWPHLTLWYNELSITRLV